MGIEIKPEDILKRPPGTAPGAGEGFNLTTVKSYMKQIKDLVDLAQQMGLPNPLAALGLKLPGQKESQASKQEQPPAANQALQILAFIKYLQNTYGDITVNELLEHLKTEFGNKRLSSFTKGMLK